MKTTVEIADGLLDEVRRLARKRKTTLRAILEDSLRRTVEESRERAPAFRLRSSTFKGDGLVEGLDLREWEHIRERIYEGRGG